MTQSRRLTEGGRIDRQKPIDFTFNNKVYQGYLGDTLASALLANEVRLVARSFKYHRPRGIVGSGTEEPNAMVQAGSGGASTPNLLSTQVEIHQGLTARSVNCWPSVDFDLRAIQGLFARFMPPGFYYKTFMGSQRAWRLYEQQIRKAGGYGTAPNESDPDHYDKMNAHCDVLVVGGGPAGIAAALEAGRTGARVILVDEQNELGGSILGNRDSVGDISASDWCAKNITELKEMKEVQLLTRSTVFGYYDHNFLAVVERVSDHLPVGSFKWPRQRIWRIRAKEVVLTTGAIERPLVFGNNDRPGVMLASAVSTYINRYAVVPGSQTVVFTNNDGAYRTVLDLLDAGISVTTVVDIRSNSYGDLPRQVRERGIEVCAGQVVVDVRGQKNVNGVKIMQLNRDGNIVTGTPRNLDCDLLAVSGGWNPTVHLHSQSGGGVRYHKISACFIPTKSVQQERSAGACNGTFSLSKCISEGMTVGASAAAAAGFGDGLPSSTIASFKDPSEEPIVPMWLVPSPWKIGHGPKQFVDPQTDTSAADIGIAAREGYQSVEHVKRYTTLGMGSDQGKIGNVNGIGILAQVLDTDVGSVGTTTFRPAYTPVAFGAIAGRNLQKFFDPVRKTVIHKWHEEANAKFEDVGQWKRPSYYCNDGESMHHAVEREYKAVRYGVGVMDASTLGKIDIRGPDSAEFLNRVYTNAWSKLQIGRCRYGFMLGEDGMLMDDGVTACLGKDHYLMHTTTGGAASIMAWLERWLQTEWPDLKVYLTSVTDHWATVSINGPHSREVITKLCDDIDFSGNTFPFMSVREGTVAGVVARIFRVSFVGELSYEINVSANHGLSVWKAVMNAGLEYDITPFGMEALHILRAEKGYLIIGQETDGSMTPSDLGADWIVSRQKKDFLGKRSLSREDTVRGNRKQLVGLFTKDPDEILPEGSQVVNDASIKIPIPMIGHVTSSYYSQHLRRSIALAMIKGGLNRIGENVYIPLVDGRTVGAEITVPQFYDPDGERQDV